MSDITANIVVQPFDINITLDQPGITINPEVIDLSIYAVGGTNGVPAGNVGDLQYYAANGFGAVPSNTANYTGSTLNLNVTETKISGGTNGYVLQTDGVGNISWVAQSGGGGNGSPGGSNTQIQYNDGGLFGGSTGFTFNKISNLISVPGNLNVASSINAIDGNFTGNVTAVTFTGNLLGSATVAGTVTNNAQPNITSIGTLTNLSVSGTANLATIIGNIATANQPNITSLGNLTSLTVVGTSTVQQIKEKVTPNATGAFSTINYDLLDQAIVFHTANTVSNFTLNFRGNSTVTLDTVMSSNQSITCSFVTPNGPAAYSATQIQIDGSNVTPKWATIPAGTAAATDIYTFNIIKTAPNTFSVFGSVIGYA
jgi:hypothetical protein